MNRLTATLLLAMVASGVQAQSKTTRALQEKYAESFTAFFYKNTLRMLNQSDNPEFDLLVKNIEKMKFLLINKQDGKFGTSEYRSLVSEYKKESFEPMITSRMDGRNFDIYLRDAKGSKPGTVVLINDSTSLYVLDIVGTIDVSKVGALFDTIGSSTDLSERIKQFTNRANEGDSVRTKSKKAKVD